MDDFDDREGAGHDERYRDEYDERYEQQRRRGKALDPWDPPPRPQRPFWAGAGMAGLLAGLLVLLVGVAVVLDRGLLDLLGSNADRSTGPTPGRTEVAESPTGSVRPSFTRPTPTPQPTFVVYVVKTGDSLNTIADEFETTARSIAFWNRDRYPNLDPDSDEYQPSLIQVGWQLDVLPGEIYDEDAEPGATPAPSG
jgi:hypothetical protein